MSFDATLLVNYPKEPGVYLMRDKKKEVLYVGKAKNLQKRLKQYFGQSSDDRAMLPFLIAKVATIDTIVTLSEKEALLLENNLIKQHQPQYNALLKDDKAYASIMINTDHKWPMLKLIRSKGRPKGKGQYFGPYTNAYAARQTIQALSNIFPLRQCSDNELIRRTRPCILYDIKKCIAPCVNKCTKEEYDIFVKEAAAFLKGDDLHILEELEKKMEIASENLEFEKAQSILIAIEGMKHVTKNAKSLVQSSIKDLDCLAIYRKAQNVLLAKLTFRSGRLTGSDQFYFANIAEEDEGLLESFLLQHYLEEKNLPKEILLPCELSSKSALMQVFQERLKKNILLTHPEKGEKKKLLTLAETNAKALFTQERHEEELLEQILQSLFKQLHLTRFPIRIECFDTSNMAGKDPVASLIAFTDGKKDTKRYRSYKIKGDKSDDYSALKEVLSRRYSKAKEENDLPDLIIVDGGKGQLQVAKKVLDDLDIASCDLIALVKEDARHDKGLTNERVFLIDQKEAITFEKHSPVLFFLQKIRDESHRRAITFHRKTRKKTLFTSALDQIEGIGPIKKKRLLQHFKSIDAIKKATEEEWKEVEGITKKDLASLKKWQKS